MTYARDLLCLTNIVTLAFLSIFFLVKYSNDDQELLLENAAKVFSSAGYTFNSETQSWTARNYNYTLENFTFQGMLYGFSVEFDGVYAKSFLDTLVVAHQVQSSPEEFLQKLEKVISLSILYCYDCQDSICQKAYYSIVPQSTTEEEIRANISKYDPVEGCKIRARFFDGKSMVDISAVTETKDLTFKTPL